MQQLPRVLLLALLVGCHREQPQPLPERRFPITPTVPALYDTLPQHAQLRWQQGNEAYLILAIAQAQPQAWAPCCVDSLVILRAGPTDSLYSRYAVLRELQGTCLSRAPDHENDPPLAIEPVAAGRHHLLIAFFWQGGNSPSSFGMRIWSFPELRTVAELMGSPELLRLSSDSILTAVAYTPFLPDEDFELPTASTAWFASQFLVLDPTVDSQRVEQLWQEFLAYQSSQTRHAYDSLRQTLRTRDWKGLLLDNAVEYVLYLRLQGKTAEAERFLRQESRFLRRLLDPTEMDYVRSALKAKLEHLVRRENVFLHASPSFSGATSAHNALAHSTGCFGTAAGTLRSPRVLPLGSPLDRAPWTATLGLVHRQ